MDYLCELPSDAARRKALDSLPPDLNSTYERILSRVNQGSAETQELVRRALRWLANYTHVTVQALCEAVSIDFGTTRQDTEAIPDEFEILHRCSSLVRKSEDGEKLELAHFTVKEFLQQIDPENISVGAYRYDPGNDGLILAKVCLTYLMFDDFDQGGPFSLGIVERRFVKYPLRRYTLHGWVNVARDNPGDTELFALVQKMLDPSKPNTLISWAQDLIFGWRAGQWSFDNDVDVINSGLAEATPLHYTAILGLPDACGWLIRSGCDVNRNTKFGTPLYCALLGWGALSGEFGNSLKEASRDPGHVFDDDGNKIVTLLLDTGADPNCGYGTGIMQLSPLHVALAFGWWNLAVQLLDKGGRIDESCLEILENHPKCEDVCRLIENAGDHNVSQENRNRLFQLALRAKTPSAARLVPDKKDLSGQKSLYEQDLRTAAEYGQVRIMLGLLEYHSLDINAADASTGLTALHHAAKTDQLGVAQMLLDRGADMSRLDNLGRTALHHCLLPGETHCLQFFLQKGADSRGRNIKGMTIWHLAAQEGNLEALSVLLKTHADITSVMGLKTDDGRTILSCASENGHVEAMSLLLNAGSSLTDTASDGSSPLHYAAKSGSLKSVEFLMEQKDSSYLVTHDGSTAIHYAVAGSWENLAEIVQILIENGVDPCKARNDGCSPLHILVTKIKDRLHRYDDYSLYKGFTAAQTLLEKMLEDLRSESSLLLGSELIYLASSSSFYSAHGVISALLKYRLDPNVAFTNGKTALMAAAERGNDEILGALLSHGADPNMVDDSGSSALHFACFNGHENILVLLRNTSIDWNKESTADIMNAQGRKRVSPLHIAAQSDGSRVLEYLLNQGLTLNIDACTDEGETPLSVAVWHSRPKNVSLLLSKEADTTIIARYGNSAVHLAAELGNEEIISEFIKHGVNLNLPNRCGLSPELIARKFGHEVLAKTIMDYVNEQSECCRYSQCSGLLTMFR